MGHGETGLVDELAAVEQQVEVDRARPPALAPDAAQPILHGEQAIEQLSRPQ